MSEKQALRLTKLSRLEEEEKAAKRREKEASRAFVVILVALVVSCCAGGVHCYEFVVCSEGEKTCVRPRSHNNSLVGYCTFVNLVSLAGDALYTQNESSLTGLMRGVCAPGERLQLSAVSGVQECVPYRSYPSALDTTIMDPLGDTHHERACGRWISASSAVTQVSSWSFYDDSKWRAAVLHAEDAGTKSHRTSIDNVAKFRSRCTSTVLSGTSGIRSSAKQAYNYLVNVDEVQTTQEALTQMGWLVSHACDAPVRVGVAENRNAFRLTFSEGAKYTPGTLAEALFAVEANDLQADAEAANTHVNDYAWNSPSISNTDLLIMTDGALRGETAAGEPATVYMTPQLDGFLHLANEGRFDEVNAFLHGVAALCSFSIVASVSDASGIQLKAHIQGLAANQSEAAALGRLKNKPTDTAEPLGELDSATIFNASSVTLSQLVGEPVGDADDDCLELTRKVFPDRLEREHYESTITPALYDRLETTFETMKLAVAATLRSNAKIRAVLQDPELAALAVAQVRLRIPGAPIGTWAGASNGVEEALFESTHGVFQMALLQARSLFLDRVKRLAIDDADLCDGPPAYAALATNAYIYPSYYCTFFLHGMLKRPFADERYDDVSLNARVGWVMAHELGHEVMVTNYLRPAYDDLFADYQASVRNEAIADLVAATAIVESNLATEAEMCFHVSQLWCARVPLGFAPAEDASHPAPNERGDKLCEVLKRVLE